MLAKHLMLLLCILVLPSCGGGGSGGGSKSQTTNTPTATPTTTTVRTPTTTTTTTTTTIRRTTEQILEGNWSWGGGGLSGSMAFSNGRVTVRCDQYTVNSTSSWIDTTHNVKATAYCSTGGELKFALNLNGERNMAGCADYHPYPIDNYGLYTRYMIGATKR